MYQILKIGLNKNKILPDTVNYHNMAQLSSDIGYWRNEIMSFCKYQITLYGKRRMQTLNNNDSS